MDDMLMGAARSLEVGMTMGITPDAIEVLVASGAAARIPRSQKKLLLVKDEQGRLSRLIWGSIFVFECALLRGTERCRRFLADRMETAKGYLSA